MIHEFIMLLENSATGEEAEVVGALDLSSVVFCYESMTDDGCTVAKLDIDDSVVIRMEIKDFIDIWRACTEDIKL